MQKLAFLKSYKFWVINPHTRWFTVKRTEPSDAEQSGIPNNAIFQSLEKTVITIIIMIIIIKEIQTQFISEYFLIGNAKHQLKNSAKFEPCHLVKELLQQRCCARRLTHTLHKLFQGCKSRGASSEAAASVRVKARFAFGTKVSAKAGVAVFYSASWIKRIVRNNETPKLG